MKLMFGILLMCFMSFVASADIASTKYVNNAIDTKVDTSASANQTMAGTYTVSGVLIVPTPPLPTAQ